MPKISEAFVEGRLSFSKVRALTRIATPHNEAWLLALALNGPAVLVEKVVRLARRYCEQEAVDLAQRAEQQRRLSWRWAADGSLIIEGRLPADVGALVVKAIEAATMAPTKTPPASESVTAVTSPSRESLVQRRADALVAASSPAAPRTASSTVTTSCTRLTAANWRADVWTVLERDPSLSAAEAARRAGCSFATAWTVVRDFGLLQAAVARAAAVVP